jgi:hypothetical protein
MGHGWADKPSPAAPSQVILVIEKMLNELYSHLGIEKSVAGLFGAKLNTRLNKVIIVVGCSHARRLAVQLEEQGESTIFIETPFFRTVTAMVKSLADTIRDKIADRSNSNVVLLLHMLDNSFFKARAEDGSYIPIRRLLPDNSYHVDGDIATAPVKTSKQMFLQLIPLLRQFQDVCKIVAVPLPRYLRRSCCEDLEHAPNAREEGHVEAQLAELGATQKLWRGISFRERLTNIKICSAGMLLADQSCWQTDPVHPTTGGYNMVASHYVRGFEAMVEKMLASEKDEDGNEFNKRPAGSVENSIPPKRPAWLSGSDNFVTRSLQYGFLRLQRGQHWNRGRGGGGGGRGWGYQSGY